MNIASENEREKASMERKDEAPDWSGESAASEAEKAQGKALTLGAALAANDAPSSNGEGESFVPEGKEPDFVLVYSSVDESGSAGPPVPEAEGADKAGGDEIPSALEDESADNDRSDETLSVPGSEGVVHAQGVVSGRLPLLGVSQDLPPTFASRIYGFFALSPLLTLSVMLLLQTIFSLDARDLWFSDEVRHADAFRYLLEQGKGVILYMNGAPYPDKPPLYFWFLRGLYEILRSEGPMLHFAGAALSALLYLWAALALGRIVGRVDRRSNLAAGIILLSTGYMMGLIHYGRMDLLFSALILVSHILLYKALTGDKSEYARMGAGFLLAGLAVMVKGPLGLALPLASVLLFALWTARPQRLFRPDFLFGLLVALLPTGVWLLLVFLESGSPDFITGSLLKQQVLERALDTFHHKEAWHFYLLRLPLFFLPWTLLAFCLPWWKLPVAETRRGIAEARTPLKQGLAFLWCMIIAALILLSALSGKILIYFLPCLAPAAILAGRAVLGLKGFGAGLLRYGMALHMLAAGILVLVAALMLFGVLPMPDFKGLPEWRIAADGGFFLVAILLLLFGALIWTGLSGSRPEGTLLFMALACTSLGYPLGGLVAPSFDAVMSPKDQGLLMRAYADKGYVPATYKVYGGTYSFYAGRAVKELGDLKEAANLATGGKVILALNRDRLREWGEKPESFVEIHRQWIESRQYVLLASPPDAGIKAAPAAYRPGPDLFRGVTDLLNTGALQKIREFFPSVPRPGGEDAKPQVSPPDQLSPPSREKAPADGATPSDQTSPPFKSEDTGPDASQSGETQGPSQDEDVSPAP